MNFFRRVKILLWTLYLADTIMGIGIFIKLLGCDLSDFLLNPEKNILFFFAIGIFVVLLIITVVLYCIKKDAQEDFSALLNYCEKNNSKVKD